MTSTVKKLLDEALALAAAEREELVEALSDSLEPRPVELGADWSAEIGDRIGQLERAEVEPVHWSEVEARIAKSLRDR